MNILMVGSGHGSWAVRGVQLGAALGARRREQPSDADLRWADVVVLIKRADPIWASQARALGKPVVWDALDFWQQPEQNHLSEAEAIRLLHAQIARLRPTLVIGATDAMASAAGGVYLPHHARPGLTPRPARARVTTVAYEGTRKYLGRWGKAVDSECRARGWQFIINPPDLAAADLIVAFRDGVHDGWLCREWKSGVKIVNAMAAGRPIITQPSAAYREIVTLPFARTIDTPDDLRDALDWFASVSLRTLIATHAADTAQPYALTAIAARYQVILQHALTRTVAA